MNEIVYVFEMAVALTKLSFPLHKGIVARMNSAKHTTDKFVDVYTRDLIRVIESPGIKFIKQLIKHLNYGSK